MIVPIGNDLPPRCVKCNAPAALQAPRKFAWHHPGWYLFILFNLIVYAVVATLVQKKSKVAFGLCDVHLARRRNFYLSAWVFLALGLLLIGSAIANRDEWDAAPLVGAVGGALLLAAGIVGSIGSRVLRATEISTQETRLKGCCSAFLDELPGK
ncbi:MAG TPA: hypothetical protein VGC21_17450 [Telluria sp.]